jgi:hypothetical protein
VSVVERAHAGIQGLVIMGEDDLCRKTKSVEGPRCEEQGRTDYS